MTVSTVRSSRPRTHDAYRGALEPEAGLARSWSFHRNPQGLWQLVVELEMAYTPAVIRSDIVGAVGADQRDTICRGVGEAVERLSLVPTDANDDAIEVDVTDPRVVPLWEHSLAARPKRAVLRTVTGVELHAAADVLVERSQSLIPRGAVDYPASTDEFDPTPSGTASGLSLEQATYNALRELLERDAYMRCWYGADTCHRFSVKALEADPLIDRLIERADAQSLELNFVLLPSIDPDVFIVSSLASRPDASIAAAGMNSSTDLSVAVRGAAQEAMQVAEVFDAVANSDPVVTINRGQVTGDSQRAAYWRQPAPIRSAINWYTGAPLTEQSQNKTLVPHCSADIVAALARVGATVHRVDLTHRLPQRIRALGWTAVKLIAPGLQGLVMDETKRFMFRPELHTNRHPHPLI